MDGSSGSGRVALQELASECKYAVYDPSEADARVGEDAAVGQDPVENVAAHSAVRRFSMGSCP